MNWQARLDARRSSAAEFTAPQDTTTSGVAARMISPFRSISTACTFRPRASVISRRAHALVHRVTFGRSIAGRTAQTSASLLA
jgi:hypothetical protein